MCLIEHNNKLDACIEWNVGRCGCKDRHQKDMCLKEIELRAQNMLTILGSIVNMIGGTCITT